MNLLQRIRDWWSGGVQKRGYNAGELNSMLRAWRSARKQDENAIPSQQVQRLRYRSWDLYRNNTHARKLVRSIESRVVGTGLKPEPQSASDEFNRAVRSAWTAFTEECDALGKPGRGGQNWNGMCRTALRGCILSGDTLVFLRSLSSRDQAARGLSAPFCAQLIQGDRLSDDNVMPSNQRVSIDPSHAVFRGVEFDDSYRRVAYWISKGYPGEIANWGGQLPYHNWDVERVPERFIRHIYVADDADQIRGVPWMSSLLLDARELGDYKYDELRAAALSACVVLGYKLPSVSGATFGGALPSWADSNDADGNGINPIPSGAMINLGPDGEIQAFNPMRPNPNAETFSQFMLRGIANGMPGTKSSTITGDYRQSSFSSERAAENDNWPEVEVVQDWLVSSFCQPIYREWVDAAILQGLIPAVEDRYAVAWNGPVCRSIQPESDQKAYALGIQIGTMSPQKAAAAEGYNWEENVAEIGEYCKSMIAALEAAGVEEQIVQAYVGKLLGLTNTPPPEPEPVDEGGADDGPASTAAA